MFEGMQLGGLTVQDLLSELSNIAEYFIIK